MFGSSISPFTLWVPIMVDAFMKSMEKGDVAFTFCERMRSSQNETLNLAVSSVCTVTVVNYSGAYP